MALEETHIKGLQVDFDTAYKLMDKLGPAIARVISVDREAKKLNQYHRDEAMVMAAIIIAHKDPRLYRYEPDEAKT